MAVMFQSHDTFFEDVKTFSVPLLEDRRGGFVKLFSALSTEVVGEFRVKEVFATVSTRDVLRGLHFQAPPLAQSKYVVVLSGSVHEVVVDIRNGSETYGSVFETRLGEPLAPQSSVCPTGIFVPAGFAHGYVVLSSVATVVYIADHDFDPDLDGGIAWDSAGAHWPCAKPILSDKDLELPSLEGFDSPFQV